ncbi:MAG: hemerythrin family protein [Propionivibrio sp.]|nr:hemerythrin family protein [Propionivibrio sp.]
MSKMSTFSDFNRQSNDRTDGEHQIQLEMLSALCRAVRANTPATELGEILQQLVAYSEAHFMSEELLMRLNSYDDYDDHVSDHMRMMDELGEMASANASGDSARVADQADSALKFIGQHIATRDKRLADFLSAGK